MSPSEDRRRHPLELRLPPPLVFVIACGLTLGVDRLTPSGWKQETGPLADALGSTWFAALRWTSIAAAVALAAWSIASFKRAGTTTDPGDPARASALVTAGPFRWVRNPMYLGLVIILAAIALGSSSPAAWLVWLALPAYLTHFQIVPEERLLTGRFGPEYLDYRRRTGRWLPRLLRA
jgi:protein-S-isoprenylcysteine O-methyltransferase Ste14